LFRSAKGVSGGRLDSARPFFNSDRLASQGGFIDLQIPHLNQSQISWHLVTRGQQHHIARDLWMGFVTLTVADDGGFCGDRFS